MAEIHNFPSRQAHPSPQDAPLPSRNQEILARIQTDAKAQDTPEAKLLSELRGMEETLLANHRQYVRLWEAADQLGITPPVRTASQIVAEADGLPEGTPPLPPSLSFYTDAPDPEHPTQFQQPDDGQGRDRSQGNDAMAKPLNHGTYQIWYKGATHAADVESVGVLEVYRMTSKRPGLWKNNPDVTLHIDHPRTTRNGDVIVDPTRGAWEVKRDFFEAVEPPAPVRDRMERDDIMPKYLQRLKQWTTHMLEAIGKDDVSIAPATSAGRAHPQPSAAAPDPAHRAQFQQPRDPDRGQER
jgi:hypothetical protein